MSEATSIHNGHDTVAFWVRLGTTGIHLVAAILSLVFLGQCRVEVIQSSGYNIVPMDYKGWASSYMNDYSCNSTMQCFRDAKPWRYEYQMPDFSWTPYLLLMYVEMATLGMSVWYLRDDFARTWKQVKTLAGHVGMELDHMNATHNGWRMACIIMAIVLIASGEAIYLFWVIDKRRQVYWSVGWLEILVTLITTGYLIVVILSFDYFVDGWTHAFQDEESLTKTIETEDGRGVVYDPNGVQEGTARRMMGGIRRMWRIPVDKFLGGGYARSLKGYARVGLDEAGGGGYVPEARADMMEGSLERKTLTVKECMVYRAQILARYLEYVATAPLFYVVILSAVMIDPPYWMFIIGYICVVGCVMYGLVLHLMHMEEKMLVELQGEKSTRMVYVAPEPVPEFIPQYIPEGDESGEYQWDGVIPPPPPARDPTVLPANFHEQVYGYSEPGGEPIMPQVTIQPIDPTNSGTARRLYLYPMMPQLSMGVAPHFQPKPKKIPIIFAPIQRGYTTPSPVRILASNEGKIMYAKHMNEKIHQDQSEIWDFFLAVLMLGKWRSNWVAKMQYMTASWLSLLMALAILIYGARELLTTNLLPIYVALAIWNLLVFYSSFGVVASMFYYFLDQYYWDYFDVALDTLSLMSKAPITFFLICGYWVRPDNLCGPNYNNVFG